MFLFFFFKQKTAYEMRISDWSSDVCSSDLGGRICGNLRNACRRGLRIVEYGGIGAARMAELRGPGAPGRQLAEAARVPRPHCTRRRVGLPKRIRAMKIRRGPYKKEEVQIRECYAGFCQPSAVRRRSSGLKTT